MRFVRTFVAVEMPDSVAKQFEQVQSQLLKADAHVKWVEPHNIHITMKFLGEIGEEQLEMVYRGVAEGAKGSSPFDVSLAGLGAFPNLNKPRVVWVGVDRGKDDLAKLQKRIEDSICQHGFPREDRSFSPHLTIGRVKSPRGLAGLVEVIRGIHFETASFGVKEVVVMESTLTPEGPIYSPLRKVGL